MSGTAPQILIFDLDGTLVDTNQVNEDQFAAMLLHEHGIAPDASRRLYRQTVGQGPLAQFTAMLQGAGKYSPSLATDMTARYWQAIEAFPPDAFPEVPAALELLQRAGHPLFVSSGSIQSSVDRKLSATGLERFFSLALGSVDGDVARSKGPGHFRTIALYLGLTNAAMNRQAIYIGDGLYDMRFAREAGVTAIGRLAGDNGLELLESGASHLISGLNELMTVLNALEESRSDESDV